MPQKRMIYKVCMIYLEPLGPCATPEEYAHVLKSLEEQKVKLNRNSWGWYTLYFLICLDAFRTDDVIIKPSLLDAFQCVVEGVWFAGRSFNRAMVIVATLTLLAFVLSLPTQNTDRDQKTWNLPTKHSDL